MNDEKVLNDDLIDVGEVSEETQGSGFVAPEQPQGLTQP